MSQTIKVKTIKRTIWESLEFFPMPHANQMVSLFGEVL